MSCRFWATMLILSKHAAKVCSIVSALLVSAFPADAQKGAKCIGDWPDSTFTVEAPVYRNCEVDRPVKMLKPETPPNRGAMFLGAIPEGRCLRATFTFVVDTTGRLELSTVRPGWRNSPEVEEPVLTWLQRVRWEPAQLDGRLVRQATEFRGVFGSVLVPPSRRGGPPSPWGIRACPQ